MTTERPTPAVPRTLVDANRVWVDSWPRAQAQRLLEARTLRALGGRVDGGRVLELGPGRRGTGLRLALQEFGAVSADGVELHADSVRACAAAVADLGTRVAVRQGDARSLDVPDASYDAVFGYHVLHHTPDWRAAVAEAARVLRPGGRVYSCEMTARIVDSRLLRAVSHHPRDADRPTPQALADALAAQGLRLLGQRTRFAGLWTAAAAVKDVP